MIKHYIKLWIKLRMECDINGQRWETWFVWKEGTTAQLFLFFPTWTSATISCLGAWSANSVVIAMRRFSGWHKECQWRRRTSAEWFDTGLQKLHERWERCIESRGHLVEQPSEDDDRIWFAFWVIALTVSTLEATKV